MKKLLQSILWLSFLFTLTSCEVEEFAPKPVGRFSTITANGLVTINLVSGEENKVISTSLTNNEYNVSYGSLNINGIGSITVAVKNLYLLSCNGCNVKGLGPLTADTLNFSIHAGSMDLKDITISRYLGITAVNTGKYRLSGSAAMLYLNITNLVDYKAFDLVTDSTYVVSNNHSDCEVHATQVINAFVNSSGDVKFRGNPPIVRASYNGSGRLIRK